MVYFMGLSVPYYYEFKLTAASKYVIPNILFFPGYEQARRKVITDFTSNPPKYIITDYAIYDPLNEDDFQKLLEERYLPGVKIGQHTVFENNGRIKR